MDRVVSILQTQPTITPYPYEQGRDAAMPIIMANTPIAHAYAKTVEITAKYGFEWDRMYRGRVKSPARVYLLARELKLMVDCVVMMLPYVVGIPDNRKIRYILEEEFEHVAPEPAADSPDRLQGMIQRWCTENADHTPLQRDANDFFKTCKNALTPAAIMEIEFDGACDLFRRWSLFPAVGGLLLDTKPNGSRRSILVVKMSFGWLGLGSVFSWMF